MKLGGPRALGGVFHAYKKWNEQKAKVYMSMRRHNGRYAQSIDNQEENTKWWIPQSTSGVPLQKTRLDMSGDVYERNSTLVGASGHRNLCG